MKKFTLITYQESSSGYREDDWQMIRAFSNDKELYEILKEGYLLDARNRNNYPICSHMVGRIFTYDDLYKNEDYVWLGGNYCDEDDEDYDEDILDLRNYDKTNSNEIKEMFSQAFEKFNKWEKKIKSLIPRIRNISKQIKLEQSELTKLFELAQKYNYTLIKG